MSRVAAPIHCKESDIKKLYTLLNTDGVSEDMKIRARIILLANEGLNNKAIAKKLDIRQNTVSDWRNRFAESGIDGLKDKERPGRRGKNGVNARAAAAQLAQNQKSIDVRQIQNQLEVSQSTVLRGLKDAGINPQGIQNLMVDSGTEPRSVELEGLYIDAESQGVSLRVLKSATPRRIDGVVRVERKGEIQADTLDQVLNAILAGGTVKPAGKASLQEFMDHFLKRRGGTRDVEVEHIVIVNGKGLCFPGTKIPDNVYILQVPGRDMWLSMIYTWIMALGSDSTCCSVYDSIRNYVDQVGSGYRPFAWYGKNEPAEEVPQVADTVLRVSAVITQKDGSMTEADICLQNAVPQMSEAEYGNKLAFANYADKVQNGILQAVTKVSADLMTKYLDGGLKKNN